jgi:hypothetical protein
MIRVVPRLLMKKPAAPSHRILVCGAAANASAPNGRVFGAFAWYFFVVFDVTLAPAWPGARSALIMVGPSVAPANNKLLRVILKFI